MEMVHRVYRVRGANVFMGFERLNMFVEFIGLVEQEWEMMAKGGGSRTYMYNKAAATRKA
jgi:hypothetical protein